MIDQQTVTAYTIIPAPWVDAGDEQAITWQGYIACRDRALMSGLALDGVPAEVHREQILDFNQPGVSAACSQWGVYWECAVKPAPEPVVDPPATLADTALAVSGRTLGIVAACLVLIIGCLLFLA